MNENESLYRVDIENQEFTELKPTYAGDINVKEKEIEKWVVEKPGILFSDPDAVMIIAQEITGELQADVLAVDSQGNLIIVEIKRHSANREVIGQILDYSARLSEWTYEQFDNRWKAYKGENAEDLFISFMKYIDNDAFNKEDFLKNRSLYILATTEDESMMRIIAWLRNKYAVPIDFVPFELLKNGKEVYLKISKIEVEPYAPPNVWSGDWFFNTNETNALGAYNKMIDLSVIAAYGYGHSKTEHKMNLPAKGDRVFVFQNRVGIIAVGEVSSDQAIQRDTVFGTNNGDEYHREVKWLSKVDKSKAVTSRECSQWGYNLPIRCTIGQMSDSRVAKIILDQLAKREDVING